MTPINPIFEAVLRGEYQAGLTLHRQRPEPTPEDDRWAGYCEFALGQPLAAKDLLLGAKARGCPAAGVELVTVLRSLGDVPAAKAELADLPMPALSRTDRAYALREAAAIGLNEGQPRQAAATLEQAWALLSGLSGAAEQLRLQTAQLLGYAHHLIGQTAPAMHYLNLSLAASQGAKRVQPLITRAQVLLYSGQYGRAGADVDEAQALLLMSPGAAAYHRYVAALLARALGRWDEALGYFQEAVGIARESGERSTEFMAELGAATVRTAQHDLRAARLHLQRAARLHQTPWEAALQELREGYLLGVAGDPAGAEQLLRARQAFVALELPRETAWADLHLAELSADRDESQALGALQGAILEQASLGSVAPLLPELRLLPRLSALMGRSAHDPDVALLLSERQQALGDEPLQVRLVTLGGARLEADGREVRLGLRRTPEVLAFLLSRGPARRDTILSALWPDDDPRRARNYLHQAVHALKEAAPYLRITFERRTELYQVECEGPVFSWDAGAIKRALSADDDNDRQRAVLAYTAPFLPEVEAEWAREERDALTFSVINVGLKLMTRWSAEGEYQKCADLSRRLLAVDPGDETLVEYLIEAVLELEGLVAAQRALADAAARAERELSVPPLWYDRLSRRIHTAIN